MIYDLLSSLLASDLGEIISGPPKDSHKRQVAARHLGALGDKSAVPALIKALSYEEHWQGIETGLGVRYNAVEALGKLGGTEAASALVTAARSDARVRHDAVKALGKIKERSTVPYLIEALSDSHEKVREEAVLALRSMGDKSAVPALNKMMLRQENYGWIAGLVANALGDLGDNAAVPALKRALGRRDDDLLTERAAEALGKLGDKSAVPRLIKALEELPRLDYRKTGASCAVALGLLGDPSAVRPLINYIDKRGRGEVEAIQALGILGDKAAAPSLVRYLPYEDKAARWALKSLGVTNPAEITVVVNQTKAQFTSGGFSSIEGSIANKGKGPAFGVSLSLTGAFARESPKIELPTGIESGESISWRTSIAPKASGKLPLAWTCRFDDISGVGRGLSGTEYLTVNPPEVSSKAVTIDTILTPEKLEALSTMSIEALIAISEPPQSRMLQELKLKELAIAEQLKDAEPLQIVAIGAMNNPAFAGAYKDILVALAQNDDIELYERLISELKEESRLSKEEKQRHISLLAEMYGKALDTLLDTVVAFTSIDNVASAIIKERPDLSPHAALDGTVTILFSDIVGSTEMTQRLGDRGAQEVLRAHNIIVREQVAAFGGYEVKSLGDGFMLAFSSARHAVECAVAVQQALTKYNKEQVQEPIEVRIGLHTGEPIKEADDFYGQSVITASRIASQAQGGEILVSSMVKELIESAGYIRIGDGREVELKGLRGSNQVYQVLWE